MDIWPYSPLVGIVEKLQFNTSIAPSRSNESASIMADVRQSFTYKFLFNEKQFSQARGLYTANPVGDWLVPVWPERSFLQGPISALDVNIPSNTSADYRVDGSAIICPMSDDGIEVGISAVNSDSLDISAPLGVDVPKGIIAPLRVMYCPQGMTIERLPAQMVRVSMTWFVRDNLEFPETSFPQFLGLDVLTDPSVSVRSLSGTLVQPVHLIDNGSGPVVMEATRDIMRGRHSAEFIDPTPEGRWDRKKWWHYLSGRQRLFWLPTWADDMALVSAVGAASNSMTVNPVLPTPQSYVGLHVMVDDGQQFFYREITSAINSGENHRLYMSPLGVDVPVARVGFLNRVRLDQDVVQINHEDGMRASTKITVLEV